MKRYEERIGIFLKGSPLLSSSFGKSQHICPCLVKLTISKVFLMKTRPEGNASSFLGNERFNLEKSHYE